MSTLTDFDPADNWSDLKAPENPIKEAKDCGDNIPFEVYSRQAPGVTRGHPEYIMSGGDLSEFAFNPHRWLLGYREDGTKATEWGQLMDCLLMAPNELETRFAVAPETYPTTAMECPKCGSKTDSKSCRKCGVDRTPVTFQKPWDFGATYCSEWKEQQGDKTIIKEKLLASAREAEQVFLSDEIIAEVLRSSRKQVMLTGFYDDKETGLRIPLRGLIDLAPPEKFLADVKTLNCGHPAAWRKHVHQFGYHEQAARHLDLWNAAHGDTRQEFRHYIQESFSPFEVGKRMLSPAFISLGRDRYVEALKRYAQCLKTNEWPGYDVSLRNSDVLIDGHLVTEPDAWMPAA